MGRGARLRPPPSGAPSIVIKWPLPVSATNAIPEAGTQSTVHSMVASCACRTKEGRVSQMAARCASHHAKSSAAAMEKTIANIAAQQTSDYTGPHWNRTRFQLVVSSTSSIGGFGPRQQCLGPFSWAGRRGALTYDPAPRTTPPAEHDGPPRRRPQAAGTRQLSAEDPHRARLRRRSRNAARAGAQPVEAPLEPGAAQARGQPARVQLQAAG